MGTVLPAVPHIAAPIWPQQCWSDGYWITMSVARCPVMPAPSHTHNKHTPSLVRPNHTAQREHINYKCTLNYFHYLPCSVNGTETGMMDGKGFTILPQVVNAPSLTLFLPFCSLFCTNSTTFYGSFSLFVSLILAQSKHKIRNKWMLFLNVTNATQTEKS